MMAATAGAKGGGESQLALAVITLAVQVIYILIEMNALGSC
jgi:hypothetical protein